MADEETHMEANQEYIDAFNAEAPDEAAMPPEGEQMSEEDAENAKAELMQDDTENMTSDEAGESTTENASAAVSLTDEEGEGDEVLTPEEEQRKRSWEGRLKKMEDDLKSREAAMNEGGKVGDAEMVDESMVDEAEVMDDAMEGAGDEAGESVASIIDDIKREASELSADPARLQATVQQMVDDYGREFVVAATALAGPMVDVKAEGYISDVNSSMSGLIDDVTEALRSMHRSTIADAHEDFEDIVQGEDFQAFLDGMDEEARAKANQIAEGGSAGQIIKLLNEFKDSMKQSKDDASFEESWAEDAAAGVKSSAPVRLPNRAPVSDEDEYKRAWNDA